MVLSAIAHGLRRAWRSPRELVVIAPVLAIAMGTAAATAAFVAGMLLRPLPYPAPDQIVRLWDLSTGAAEHTLSSDQTSLLSTHATLLREVAAFADLHQTIVLATGERARVKGLLVSPRLFELLEVRPRVGDSLATALNTGASPLPPVVISDRLVRTGIAEGRVGARLTLDGLAYEIVGIMADTFAFPDGDTSYWIAMPPSAGGTTWHAPVLARMAPHATPAIVEAEARALLSTHEPHALVARSYHSDLVATTRGPLLLVFAAALLLVAASALTAAWLFVARAYRFRPTVTTMAALGARPQATAVLALTEACFTALVATPAALGIAWLLVRGAIALNASPVPRLAETSLTLPVMLGLLVSALTVTLIAATPGLIVHATAARAPGLLRARVSGGRDPLRRHIALAAQTALVFALTAQAVGLTLAFRTLLRVNVGLDHPDFMAMRVVLPPASALAPEDYLARLRNAGRTMTAAGLRVAFANTIPLSDADQRTGAIPADDASRPKTTRSAMVGLRVTSPEYFGLTGLTPLAGRALHVTDRGSGRALVTESLARQFFGQLDVVGRTIVMSGAAWTIVGIMPDLRHADLTSPTRPTAYILYDDVARLLPFGQSTALQAFYVLAADLPDDTPQVVERLRLTLRTAFPEATVDAPATFGMLVWRASGLQPLITFVATAFAVVAVILVLAGFYATTVYSLVATRRELAIRLALGATPTGLAASHLWIVLRVYTVGLALGMGLAFLIHASMLATTALPPGAVPPGRGLVLSLAAGLLAIGIGAACVEPSLRLTRINPARALREG